MLGLAWAGSGLHSPELGRVRDETGALRVIWGVRGNVIPGDTLADGVVSASFWGAGGVIKTAGELLVVDAAGRVILRQDAPSGAALFGLPRRGWRPPVYFPNTNELWQWGGDRWRAVDNVHWDGDPVALGPSGPGWLTVVVKREDLLWKLTVSARTGAVRRQRPLPGASEPLLVTPQGSIVYIAGDEAVLRDRDGVERRLSLPAPVIAIEPAAGDWLHLLTASPSPGLLLRLSPDAPSLCFLPEGKR